MGKKLELGENKTGGSYYYHKYFKLSIDTVYHNIPNTGLQIPNIYRLKQEYLA